MAILRVDTKKVAQTMIDHFDFDPSVENMENDRENYSYALLDALVKLHDFETLMDAAIYTVSMKKDE